MATKKVEIKRGRVTAAQKNANNKQWYKDRANELIRSHNGTRRTLEGSYNHYNSLKANYDLFNNIINKDDMKYVCEPYGEGLGDLPATMANRDIVSSKIKYVLGMEMKKLFSWKAIAVNQEATSRKEQKQAQLVRDFVVSQIMTPIKIELEQKAMAEANGKELNDKEKQEIQQRIEQELKARTPEEVKRYMEREHQDPSEVMSNDLLQYLIKNLDIQRKFDEAFKHSTLSARECMYIGILNDKLKSFVVNSLDINAKLSRFSPFYEDSESISVEYRMSPTEIMELFGDELTDKEVDRIYTEGNIDTYSGDLFELAKRQKDGSYRPEDITVTHTLWKALRKLMFLDFIDEEGILQTKIVDESYQLDESIGDVELTYEWVTEIYETWTMLGDIHVAMRPLPGQFKDIDDLYTSKMPYYGVVVDDMNSTPTSIMDRIKDFQYLYNIVWYRLELLMASDEGKKIMMNIKAIPNSLGIDMKQFMQYGKSMNYLWFNPDEEGTNYADVSTIAKVLDLSLASDISKYMEVLEYLKQQAGKSIGVTDNVEGQTGQYESVQNNQQNLIQSSHVLEPYFNLHSIFKRNYLQGLIETAKIYYLGKENELLSYVLDDLSLKMFEVDTILLNNSKLGIFVANNTKIEEVMQTIRQLSHAAMQNQKIELSDVLSLLTQEDVIEAKETLKVAEKERKEFEANQQQAQAENTKELQNMQAAENEKEFEREKELVVLKEEERRKTEIVKTSLLGASFNPDQDKDKDGVNDFIELAKNGLDAEIKQNAAQLEREKFEHQKEIDKEKIKIEKKKLNKDKKV